MSVSSRPKIGCSSLIINRWTRSFDVSKIDFGWSQKDHFEGFEFWFVEKFQPRKCTNVHKNSKFRPAKMVQMVVFLGLQNDQNWFHVKDDWEKNSEISTLCIPKKAAQVCIGGSRKAFLSHLRKDFFKESPILFLSHWIFSSFLKKDPFFYWSNQKLVWKT